MKLLLIAGHGGNPFDPGATGNGVREADLTRDFAESFGIGLPRVWDRYRFIRYNEKYGSDI